MHIVTCQKWEESELGWGVRPDGYSLHVTEPDREKYIRNYWEKMPCETPDEYERPSGNPYICTVPTDLFEEIKNSECGLRFYNNNYPGSGGDTGWIKIK